MEVKSNHKALIVRLGAPRVHTNADTLEIFDIPNTGYQVVSKKGSFKEGDLGVYIQPDSVVPQTMPFEFIWGPYSIKKAEPGLGTVYSDVPEKRRRITVRKLRGEWSEGLLMPLLDFSGGLVHEPEMCYGWLKDGDDVSELLNITHYNPDREEESKANTLFMPKKKKGYPRSLRGWFYFILSKLRFRTNGLRGTTEDGLFVPVYDVEALKNHKNVFQAGSGEYVLVTEKIHGSNGRFVYVDGHMYAGSRNQWKAADSNCVWRKALVEMPWIEKWCRAHEGFVLYGEVTPTQKGFNYGSDKVQFFVFDILTPEGKWLDKLAVLESTELTTVPLLFGGDYDEDLLSYVTGPSVVPHAKHIREGIVISAREPRHIRGLGRAQLKLVSNSFLEKDSK